ncbi:hypothetical protein [Streptomyces jumonjinensis]|uniref:Uncharacterized protein n=1 Tax=Streptomyces jumonjinensis TaxID=1945 RepID=A0A646KQJ5_STRJU|nr:hypothetical protein [Streptomyces jumonjinensis]MQT04370.1 hypothetical protein [Streptomyces jumonjinensis]
MTSPEPPYDPAGESGLDYLEQKYPSSGLIRRVPTITGTYPPREKLSPAERQMMGTVANRVWHYFTRFETPVLSALEGLEAAVRGQNDVIDHVAHNTLGIPSGKAASWREAVSTALLGDWVPILNEANADLLVPKYLRQEVARVHRDLQPLWERKVRGRRVEMLGKPVTEGLTLQDVAADGSEPDQGILRVTIDNPRILEVLGALDPDEREVALAWARGGASVRNWGDAARLVGAARPDDFGERVRRKLKYIASTRSGVAAKR